LTEEKRHTESNNSDYPTLEEWSNGPNQITIFPIYEAQKREIMRALNHKWPDWAGIVIRSRREELEAPEEEDDDEEEEAEKYE
jgi:hypothetical protein